MGKFRYFPIFIIPAILLFLILVLFIQTSPRNIDTPLPEIYEKYQNKSCTNFYDFKQLCNKYNGTAEQNWDTLYCSRIFITNSTKDICKDDKPDSELENFCKGLNGTSVCISERSFACIDIYTECGPFPCINGSCMIKRCNMDGDCMGYLCSRYASAPHGYCVATGDPI